MAKANAPADAASDRELVITRTLNAPRELVFEAWTDPAHLVNWWGPDGFTNSFHEFNMEPGGTWRFIMHGPDGTDYPNRIVFEEVVKPERLTYTHDSDVDNDPRMFRVTVTFEAQGDKTVLTMRSLFATAEALEAVKKFGAVEGGKQTLDHLAAEVEKMATQKPFVLTRSFNAPRELVFRAFTEAERLAKWWGPKGFDLQVKQLDVRPGGTFHYRMVAANGNEMWGKFVYREISAPERILFVSSFSDAEGNVTSSPFGIAFPLRVMNTWTFSEKDGKTTITLRGGPINATEEEVKTYEGMSASMNQGFGGTFDQLDAYLGELKAEHVR